MGVEAAPQNEGRGAVGQEDMSAEGGEQSTAFGLRCWKVWAQGLGSGWAGIMRYGESAWHKA